MLKGNNKEKLTGEAADDSVDDSGDDEEKTVLQVLIPTTVMSRVVQTSMLCYSALWRG